MKKNKTITIGFITYFLMAALTYGYIYNHELELANKYYSYSPASNDTFSSCAGVCGSVIWPLYWPYRFSSIIFSHLR